MTGNDEPVDNMNRAGNHSDWDRWAEQPEDRMERQKRSKLAAVYEPNARKPRTEEQLTSQPGNTSWHNGSTGGITRRVRTR